MPVDMVRLRATFAEATAQPDCAARAAYLDRACNGDAELRSRVESLLTAYDGADSFLQLPGCDEPTPSLPSLSELPGTLIDRYKLLEQIGEGGFGVVFMAEQESPMRRLVALKIIKHGMDTRQVVARFEAERQTLALMDHPNVAKVFDGGATETGRPYFVMELVKGLPITNYCDQERLPIRQRLELFTQVCQAVQHAHQKGIIHRDLKPTNVLVAEYDGQPVPKVIDFGVAKAIAQKLTERTMFTQFGQLVGTFEYMSPEQARFNQLDVDIRSDIYSLGVLLYELLTGSTPLEQDRVRTTAFDEVLRIIREEEPPRPSLRLGTLAQRQTSVEKPSSDPTSVAANRALEPKNLCSLLRGELDWVVMKCLAKDRGERYATATELAADIQHWLCGEPLSVLAPDPSYLLRLWARQNLGAGGWAVALGLIWGSLLGFVCWVVMDRITQMPMIERRLILLLGLYVGVMAGPLTIWLVRPRNQMAELIAGLTSGTLGAIAFYTISFGAICVSVFGVPYGIWYGMGVSLLFMNFACAVGTLAAGMLQRRFGSMRAALIPHFELMLPATLLVGFINNSLYSLITGWNWVGFNFVLPVVISLLLAIYAVLAGWRWQIRIVLLIAWVTSLYLFAVEYSKNAS